MRFCSFPQHATGVLVRVDSIAVFQLEKAGASRRLERPGVEAEVGGHPASRWRRCRRAARALDVFGVCIIEISRQIYSGKFADFCFLFNAHQKVPAGNNFIIH